MRCDGARAMPPLTDAQPRVTDALDRHGRERPCDDAVVDGRERLSWSALREAVDAGAATLRAQGVRPGQRVGLRATDGAAALVAALSAMRLGAVHVPVDHQLAEPEAQELLRVLEVEWLVEPPSDAARAPSRWALARRGESAAGDPLPPPGSAFVRLSSGTTGDAKGVLIGHAALALRIAAANGGLGLGAQDRVLWLLPMAYHFAVSIMLYVEVGSTVVFGNHLRAAGTAAIARAERVTMAYGSPYHVRRLAALPARRGPAAHARKRRLDHHRPRRQRRGATSAPAMAAACRQALGLIEVGLPFISDGRRVRGPGRARTSAAGLPRGDPLQRGRAAVRTA